MPHDHSHSGFTSTYGHNTGIEDNLASRHTPGIHQIVLDQLVVPAIIFQVSGISVGIQPAFRGSSYALAYPGDHPGIIGPFKDAVLAQELIVLGKGHGKNLGVWIEIKGFLSGKGIGFTGSNPNKNKHYQENSFDVHRTLFYPLKVRIFMHL